jgi:hypothetical protein
MASMRDCSCRLSLFQRLAVRSRTVAALSVVAAFALAGLLGTATPAMAEGPPKGIRAPDAWGAILPVASGSEPSVWQVFFDHDGRLVVHYGYSESRPSNGARGGEYYVGRVYDLGARHVITEIVSSYSAPREIENKRVRQWEASVARLSAGKALEVDLSFVEPAKLVSEHASLERTDLDPWPHLHYGLRKTDHEGRELFHVAILYTPRDNSKRRHPRNDAEGGSSEIFVRTRALFPIVHDLKDGTYVLTGMDEPLVIRYHGNFQSPFLDRSDEVLVMDVDTFEAMTAELLAEMVAANLTDPGYHGLEVFWNEFDERLTARVRALIAAKRKKN